MFEVFTQEIEQLLKDGISNLYWYKDDLKKAWISAGVKPELANSIRKRKNSEGREYTKREMMGLLYDELHNIEYNRRLEISRNFVRFLVEHTNFIPQKPEHKIDIAERCALKLREIMAKQVKEREKSDFILQKGSKQGETNHFKLMENLADRFTKSKDLEVQKRGYELENIFQELMQANKIPVEKPFKITGEQIDGAIKYDSHYYIIELRWRNRKANQNDISSLFLKAEGKQEAKGIFISMEGYSEEMLESLPKGKELKVILLDGNHLANTIYSTYGPFSFKKLLDHAIGHACLKGNIYCPRKIS